MQVAIIYLVYLILKLLFQQENIQKMSLLVVKCAILNLSYKKHTSDI